MSDGKKPIKIQFASGAIATVKLIDTGDYPPDFTDPPAFADLGDITIELQPVPLKTWVPFVTTVFSTQDNN